MTRVFRLLGIPMLGLALVCAGAGPTTAQVASPPAEPRPTFVPRKVPEAQVIEKINAWTVGLAAGQLEGAPIRFATEIARVVDDGDDLHVLPIVTRGPLENVEALLYLKGIDVAIINSDSLEEFKTLVPNIQQKITYILSLFPSELHIFVRPEITSLDDLKGKKVNFNTPGTAAAFSGPLMFERLKLDVKKTFIPHQVALQQMRAGQEEMAAVVFVTSKPVDAFRNAQWDAGFKFLSVPFDETGPYLPSTLTSNDYPRLIPAGQEVQTIAVPTVLAAYNWNRTSDRYRRVARLTEHLFTRLERLQVQGFHSKWKDVNLAAKVPGLERFPAAQELLDRMAAARAEGVPAPAAAASAPVPALTPEQQRLYQEFLEWRRTRGR